ncbi:MAG: AbrB/MazE/SpoVT family DNA-binding domain-containing protein [Clostridiales bacterium]|nr:AbrB/MazE/SpoVT family DNA-binding domain-containing protein [Clostridiales bacterium]
MKSTGMTRRVDELGRIVLPVELRRTLGIEERDSLEIFVNEDTIVLRKYQPGCVHCGSIDRLTRFRDSLICDNCRKEIARQPLKN